MSLWKKIGLPDQTMVATLQEEICALREENRHLMADYARLLTDCIQRESSKSSETVTQKIDAGLEQQNELKKQFSVFQQSQSDSYSEARTILGELQKNLKTAIEGTEQADTHVKEFGERLLAVVDEQKTLFESDEIRGKLNEIPEIQKLIFHLWEAMKLVWINDLLDCCHETTQH